MSGLPAWGSDKRIGNPQGIWPWRPGWFNCRTSIGLGETKTPVSGGTNKISPVSGPRRGKQWLHRRLNQNHPLVLEGLLWRFGSAGAHHRDGGTGSSSLKGPPWHKPSWILPLTIYGDCHRAQRGWVPQAKQLLRRECNPTHQQIIGLKSYWEGSLPTRANPVFPSPSQ